MTRTPLKFHIEKFDPQAQIALVWVRLPQITGGMNADKFYLYYGNPKGAAAADPAGTYDSNQSLVYHFAAAAPAAQDSTGFKIEPQNVTATYEAASLIGGGLRFAGTSAFNAPAAPALQLVPAQGYTVSAWLRAGRRTTEGHRCCCPRRRQGTVAGIDGEQAFAVWRDGGREVRVVQPTGSAAGEWHHVALRAANGQLSLLVDGVQVAAAAAALQPMNGALTVGGAAAGGGFYRGEMDELQVANTARSDAWLRAAATSQGMGRAAAGVWRRRAEGRWQAEPVVLRQHAAQCHGGRLGDHRRTGGDVRLRGADHGLQAAVPESRRGRQCTLPRRIQSHA
ncbi:MAG: DUF2341 domain-containing protein [Pseudomonadota bacterium]